MLPCVAGVSEDICLPEVQDESGLHVRMVPLLDFNHNILCMQAERHSAGGEAVQSCVPDSMQLWQGLYSGIVRSQAGDYNEGVP